MSFCNARTRHLSRALGVAAPAFAAVLAFGAGGFAAGQTSAQQRVTPGDVRRPSGASSLVGTSGVSGIQSVAPRGA